ncbi:MULTISPECIES: hypothetical protein [Kyrpidia]|uniref:Uncharacterized protein n=3 Tax=Kyrpidia TaxID=1129704 RepID=A0ACA8Z6A1_9BACL|nr:MULTISPECIES: hypothetical protein [Kyrpidia]ADG06791.1 hypothetical protein Btus_2108 [Kyrpidia tusciae DSM 2912]MCL6576944.1 hypothetical protein [Kyrpidia sp.]CAB3390001.1 conserved protein of unknown function [Kyrpidia spormannii]CAB3390918.1 conserved protein of unknown function [Kyrpidia spormannii]
MNLLEIEKKAEFLRQQLGGLIFAFLIDEGDPYSKFAVVVYTGDGFRTFPEPLDFLQKIQSERETVVPPALFSSDREG